MERAAHRGNSNSSEGQRNRVVKLFDEWRSTLTATDARNLAPASIASIQTADALAKRETYERFGTWLVDEYVTREGGPIGPGTAIDYFGCLMNLALDRAMVVSKGRLPAAAADFFRCLEGGQRYTTIQAAWFRGLKNNLRRKAVGNLIENGKPIDNSADPVYATHVISVVCAYARIGGAEAARRKLTVNATWDIAGRSSEGQWLSYEGMRWDDFYKTVFVESLQTKTSKVKVGMRMMMLIHPSLLRAFVLVVTLSSLVCLSCRYVTVIPLVAGRQRQAQAVVFSVCCSLEMNVCLSLLMQSPMKTIDASRLPVKCIHISVLPCGTAHCV